MDCTNTVESLQENDTLFTQIKEVPSIINFAKIQTFLFVAKKEYNFPSVENGSFLPYSLSLILPKGAPVRPKTEIIDSLKKFWLLTSTNQQQQQQQQQQHQQQH